ncbi:MAG: T9SS type A sorting domain-containing protein [Ferruginibacter sp.]
MKKIYVRIFLILISPVLSFSQVSMTVTGNYTQDFNTLLTTGSATWADNSTIANWYGQRTGTGTSIAANNGASNAGNLYSYGTGTNAERALGSLGSGNAAAGSFAWGLQLRNNSASVITDLRITYTGEQWRNSAAAAQTVAFYYKISSSPITALNPAANGTWTAVAALDFVSPITGGVAGALDGDAVANRTTLTNIAIPSLALAAGDYIMIKWDDPDQTGSDHGLSIDDVTVDWTVTAGGTPDIVLSSLNPAVTAGNIAQGSTSLTNNPIYRFDLAVTTADATLNGVTINTAGTYAVADITNFKCWYSSDATFSPLTDAVLSTLTPVTIAGAQVFPSFTNQTILNGASGYFFITADVTCAATVGNTISVAAITTADISFVSGNKSGTAFAGDVQTITAATVFNVTGAAASVGNTLSSVSWISPTGCYDEVMIVAAAAVPNSGTPTGDGTAYTASASYGAGTALGNGFVVYKGASASPQIVNTLVNGTTYYFKIYTRFGTTWSSGVEVNATPDFITNPTDFFRSVASGSWATLATWQSSVDSASWIAATVVPGATAAHVVIQSPDSVWLDANRTTANLTLNSGAIMNALTFSMTATVRFNLLGTSTYYQGGTVTTVPGSSGNQVLAVTSNYRYNGTQAGTAAALPAFGNLFWEPVPTGSGTFQNNTPAAPFNNGLVVRGNMTINIQGPTVREVRFATGTTVSRTHTIDGNLNIISSFSTVVVQNGSNAVTSIVNIGGDINISAGILQGTSSTAATNGSSVIYLRGNINNTGGTIQTGASTAGFFSFNYGGTSPQSINNTGGTFTFTTRQADTLNKPSGDLTLNTPITHAGYINFLSGIVNTTAINLLTMEAGSLVLNVSNSSYVNGPVKKIGNTDFTFPVGKANGYVPLRVSNFTGASAPTDEFTAEYIRSSGNALGGNTAIPAVNRISACEYWTLDVNAGTPTVDLTLYWNANNPCNGTYISNVADIEVVHFDGANWNTSSIGFSSKTGTTTAGDVTWTGVSTFSPFTLASSTAANPLPITINYFNGTKSNGNHLLNWKVTCASTPSATIEMERSTDGRNYISIYSIFATAVRCQQPFNYTDNQPAKGINYYRLKMTDADGKITYSTTVTLINAVKGIDVMNIAPNPIVNGTFNVKISTAEKIPMELVITDMQGRVLQKQLVPLIAGFNQVPVNVRNLSAGTYQLFGYSADGRTRVLRFVIQ